MKYKHRHKKNIYIINILLKFSHIKSYLTFLDYFVSNSSLKLFKILFWWEDLI